MKSALYIFSVICIFTGILSAPVAVAAQERPVSHDGDHEPRRRAVVLDINARVLENEQNVVWSESHQKITIPGTPVGIQLVGSNVVVAVQFTPFIRRNNSVLVAQVQLGIKDPDHGISYHTSIQTIPIEFNEPILFFPLGQTGESSIIEIILTVNPYRGPAPEAVINAKNDE